MLGTSCCKHIAVRGMGVKHGTSPASLRARWTLNGIKLSVVHCMSLTRRILIFCLCWSKESRFWLNISSVGSNDISVVLIGELARYSSSGALGRNYTRCQNAACLETPWHKPTGVKRCSFQWLISIEFAQKHMIFNSLIFHYLSMIICISYENIYSLYLFQISLILLHFKPK